MRYVNLMQVAVRFMLLVLCRWRFCFRHLHSCWWTGYQGRLARRLAFSIL